jgi:hypothetical protein
LFKKWEWTEMSKTRTRNYHVAAKRITKRRDRLMVKQKREAASVDSIAAEYGLRRMQAADIQVALIGAWPR